MRDSFQRLFMMAESEILPLNAQAARGGVRAPQRTQIALLVHHFLERFFNHETASPDGDAKARAVLVALATGLPGFAVAVYLWPVYHPFPGWPLGSHSQAGPPPYWLQVNHHFFFVIYSFVAMGIATVFEWDLFFPDLLDLFVLKVLPIADRRLFTARVAAIAILVAGFLFDANVLALLVLPAATDPPHLLRFLSGHLLAVGASGLFAAVFILALQSLLLSILGERLFRRLSLLIQGLAITVLLVLLLLFPVLSAAVPVLLRSGNAYALCIPPFWFLGIYQRLLEGSSALPIYAKLAQIGVEALLLALALAVLAYPIAYLRRVRQLVEGAGTRDTRNRAGFPIKKLLHITLVRPPVRRAVFHFISQTVLRVQRYRIYLVLYGGAGLSVVAATILRLSVVHGQVRSEISIDGLRAAIGITAFWTIAGLRIALLSPGNRQGSWVFRIIHGRPPQFLTAMELLMAGKLWALLCALTVTFAFCLTMRAIAPPALLSWQATASVFLIAGGMCLLLSDILFLNVKTVAFTGEPSREQSNLALSVLKYFVFVPAVAAIPVLTEPWIEKNAQHLTAATVIIVVAHAALRGCNRRLVAEHCQAPALEDGEAEFPMKLGLR